ncbi:divergent PAP2 family protein [Aerococcus sanguinicola]|uniref:Divergent PAP2 family protein n=1 Tax=Aerococcus sanguinicola TaxID=119206 RepID=A0A109REH6_9LACT|nr:MULTISPECIES: divergent PAP2 family protein [Aerococcus]AMB93430.1 hypothetical protein AWM72_01060 [Aerococcus sanguinicola]MDK7051041.1 divergent PAP2 family protein [Aerococcus sanguinicola]OFT94489.1 hypothetical protein HMPREF3090_05865 [Aerococcus sp. HMSC23C02]PKZ20513.1 divergent PAP2 family protein [Aerococcus sanguinicola]
MDVLTNLPLVATLSAIVVAQALKFPIALLMRKSNAKLALLHATGSMPSSHSAAVTALITALILKYGYQSAYVAIGVCFGVIIMFDAMGVRRQSGEQGMLLRQLLLILEERAAKEDDPVLSRQLKAIKESKLVIDDYLGHKPSEVIGGILTGILVTLLLNSLFNF